MSATKRVDVSWPHDDGVVTASAKIEHVELVVEMDEFTGQWINRRPRTNYRVTMLIDSEDVRWHLSSADGSCDRTKEYCRRIFDDESVFTGRPEHWL